MQDNRIIANTRTLAAPLTGVQRYTREILRHAGAAIGTIAPAQPLLGAQGHLWDQSLGWRVPRNALLWSPANVGPLACAAQVVTVHDVAALDFPQWQSRAFGAWYRWLTPRLMRRVRAVLTVSEFTRQRLLAHTRIAPERVHVVPNGVDERFAPRAPEAVQASLASLSLPSGRYVLTVGSIEPRKNVSALLQAWTGILPQLPPDVWLVVAGMKGASHIHRDALGGTALPPRVHLPGHVADEQLPALYAGAMCFAYPSLYEGFGLPPLEAMASGVAVVSSSTTAIPEVVGDAGLLVEPSAPQALGQALLTLIGNPSLRQRLAHAGLQRASAYTWRACAERTLAILQQQARRPA